MTPHWCCLFTFLLALRSVLSTGVVTAQVLEADLLISLLKLALN